MSGDSSGLEGVGVFVNWELDLWGRVRSGAAAARVPVRLRRARLPSTPASRSPRMVAKGWFLATEARMQKALADETVRASERLVGLAQDRLRVGVGDEYDVPARAGEPADLSRRRAAASTSPTSRRCARSRRSSGRYPAAVVAVRPELAPRAARRSRSGCPPSCSSAGPDVIAAERRVAAAFYRTEEAKAARLPRISLTAAVTSISSELFVLKEQDNPVWSAGRRA